MTPLIFNETQRFRQVWIWAILLGVTGIASGTMGYQLLNDPQTSLGELLIPAGVLIFVNGLFFFMRLTTRFDSESISYSYFPFLSQRKYNWKEIESIELIEYKALADYGGWGIKWNGANWSYTTGGAQGIFIKTKGKKFLLGTQKPKEVKKIIDHFNSSTHVG
ncbi:MAG: hypothetical protein NBV57_06395 [Algoriphagus sp.]|nr:hypothetical protein [Algoriphagus sp.]